MNRRLLFIFLSLLLGAAMGQFYAKRWLQAPATREMAIINAPLPSDDAFSASPSHPMELWLASLDDEVSITNIETSGLGLWLLHLASDPARKPELLAALNDQPPAYTAIGRIVSHIFAQFGSNDPKAALEMAHQLRNYETDAVQAVFESWAALDPQAALDWILDRPDTLLYRLHGVNSIMATWTRHDPSSALNGLLRLQDFLEGANYNAYQGVAKTWLESDADGFRDWIDERSNHPLRKDKNFLGACLSAYQAKNDHAGALALALAIEDSENSAFLLAKTVERSLSKTVGPQIIELDYEAPSAMFSQIPSHRITEDLVRQLGKNLAVYVSTAALTEPLSQALQETGLLETFWTEMIGNTDRPQVAIKELERLQNVNNRVKAVRGITRTWCLQDHEAAAAWLKQLPLSPEREAGQQAYEKAYAEATGAAQK